jgi:phage terminase large subunit GpA-like protein
MVPVTLEQRTVYRAFADNLKPIPRLTVSQWADSNRELTRETSPEYGRWRTSRVPYTREIMDSLSSLDRCEMVAWMKCSQIAATEVGLNWIGYSIEQDPGPFMLVVPSDPFARRYSKRRIRPMIDACPALRALVKPARSRDSGNTTTQKDFPGGSLIIASAQSAPSLSSDPVRRVMLDEVDRFPRDVSQEGSPIGLAETRTTNFPNRKIYVVSSPATRERSSIEPLFLQGDQRRYFVPCPHCPHVDFITWRGLDPFKSEVGGIVGEDGVRRHFSIVWDEGRTETAAMMCPACKNRIPEHHKPWMLREKGFGGLAEWLPTAAGDGYVRSYHTPGMYSPLGWLSWSKMAREFVRAEKEMQRGAREAMQTCVNTRLGECWEETMDKIEKQPLLKRAEKYSPQVPAGVGVLVASVDVQDDRLEAQVVGYGAGEESWLIDWRAFRGDPENDALWLELDEWLVKPREHERGRAMLIECVAVDSGGHHSEKVYEFCKLRFDRSVFAVRGGVEIGQPLVGKPTANNRYRTPLFTLCVDTGKDRVYSRLKITEPGPGYLHFPIAWWFDEEYVEQLVSERKVPGKFLKGRGAVPYWKKTRARNEALDLTVYALAALYIMGGDFIESLAIEAERWARPLDDDEPPAPTVPADEVPPNLTPASSFVVNPFGNRSWVNGWPKR